jgi:hypothetical protein
MAAAPRAVAPTAAALMATAPMAAFFYILFSLKYF